MYHPTFKIENGQVKESGRFMQYLNKLKGQGSFKIEIHEIKLTRTLNQNNFYWNYLRIIEEETGNNSVDLHEYFKRKLLPPRFITVLDEKIKVPATTTRLSKLEFGQYIDKIGALTNIPIPILEY